MGGLSRRASVIAETPKPRLVVEGGNWAWKSSYIKDSQIPQQKLKAELQLHAFQRSGIDAIGIGASDLVLGLDWFQERIEDHPFIATNMQCGDRYPFQRYQVTEKAGLQLGVVSLISQKAKIDGCSIESPSDAVKAVLKDQKDVDLWIVLSGLPEKENQALAAEHPLSLFVDAKSRLLLQTPKSVGQAALLGVGSRGKHLGIAELTIPSGAEGVYIVGLEQSVEQERKRYATRIDKAQKELQENPTPSKKKRLERQVSFYQEKLSLLPSIPDAQSKEKMIQVKSQLVDLNRSIEDEREIAKLVQQYKEKIENLGSLEQEEYQGPFIGSKSCQGCHPVQYAQWETTAHASAWDTLVKDSRSQDRACFSCHVTGAHHEKGPQSPAAAKNLTQVGCESCHGPGAEHVARSGQADMIAKPTVDSCRSCHDGVKDEGRFEPATYYPKVKHDYNGD